MRLPARCPALAQSHRTNRLASDDQHVTRKGVSSGSERHQQGPDYTQRREYDRETSRCPTRPILYHGPPICLPSSDELSKTLLHFGFTI